MVHSFDPHSTLGARRLLRHTANGETLFLLKRGRHFFTLVLVCGLPVCALTLGAAVVQRAATPALLKLVTGRLDNQTRGTGAPLHLNANVVQKIFCRLVSRGGRHGAVHLCQLEVLSDTALAIKQEARPHALCCDQVRTWS